MPDFIFRPIDRWPHAETKSRRRSRFRASYTDTTRLLCSEVDKLDGRDMVIQVDLSDRDIRLDGLPYAKAYPRTPRVILSIKSKHGPLSYPCDCFDDWKDNLRAIALALGALRAVDRYGVTRRGEQYQGWNALPAPSSNGNGFASVEEAAAFMAQHSDGHQHHSEDIIEDPETFRDAYRTAARNLHPDLNGGNDSDFKKLQAAKEFLEAACA